jgi:hypothetical protein
MSDSHVEQGEACAKFAETLQTKKTLDDDELGKLMPTSVSGIAPGKPIERAGQPPLVKAEGASLIFSKVFGEDE